MVQMTETQPGQYQVQGQIDFDTVLDLKTAGDEAIILHRQVCFDLASVTSAKSVILALVLHWMRSAKTNKTTMTLKNIPSNIQQIIPLMGLEEMMQGIVEH